MTLRPKLPCPLGFGLVPFTVPCFTPFVAMLAVSDAEAGGMASVQKAIAIARNDTMNGRNTLFIVSISVTLRHLMGFGARKKGPTIFVDPLD